ncbi:hypothetical protein OROHE_011450 [Orobanche hederae]
MTQTRSGNDKERLESVENSLTDLQLAMKDQAAFRTEMTVAQSELMKQMKQLAAAVMGRQFEDSSSRGSGFAGNSDGSFPRPGATPDPTFPVGYVAVKTRELPEFGGLNPLACIAQAEQYFLVHKTLVSDRVRLAMIAMSGPRLPKSRNAPIRGTKTGTGYVSVPGTRYGRGRLLQIAKLERKSLSVRFF